MYRGLPIYHIKKGQIMKLTKLKITLAIVLFGTVQYTFAESIGGGLTMQQATAQIQGESSQVIAKAVTLFKEGKISESMAMAAIVQVLGINNSEIGNAVSALITAGADSAAVVSAAVSAGVNPQSVVSAAIKAGAPANAVISAAVSAGADPTMITASSAAGRSRSGGEGGNDSLRGREGGNDSLRGRSNFTLPGVNPVPSGGRTVSHS